MRWFRNDTGLPSAYDPVDDAGKPLGDTYTTWRSLADSWRGDTISIQDSPPSGEAVNSVLHKGVSMEQESNPDQHSWLRYAAQHGSRDRARQIVAEWFSYGSQAPASVTHLRKAKHLHVSWIDHTGVKRTARFRFDHLVDTVVRSCDFDTAAMGLPPMGSLTLRSDFHYSHNLPPITDHTGTLKVRAVGSLGPHFPLIPTLDREGMIFTSFDGVLYSSVLELRARLVDQSAGMILEGPRWFNDLRLLVNDVVSAVEIALTYLYQLAEHAPKPGWRFDPSRLGVRHGRRMEDKLRWVEAITSHPLNAPAPRAAFKELRELRNHLNHFDPPCIAYSVDDAAHWLNLVPAVGELLWEIKKCMHEPLSRDLVRWLLLRPVAVLARDPSRPRPAQLPATGYASTRWP